MCVCGRGDLSFTTGNKIQGDTHLRRSQAETNTVEERMRKPTCTQGADVAFPEAHDPTHFLVTYAKKNHPLFEIKFNFSHLKSPMYVKCIIYLLCINIHVTSFPYKYSLYSLLLFPSSKVSHHTHCIGQVGSSLTTKTRLASGSQPSAYLCS